MKSRKRAWSHAKSPAGKRLLAALKPFLVLRAGMPLSFNIANVLYCELIGGPPHMAFALLNIARDRMIQREIDSVPVRSNVVFLEVERARRA